MTASANMTRFRRAHFAACECLPGFEGSRCERRSKFMGAFDLRVSGAKWRHLTSVCLSDTAILATGLGTKPGLILQNT